MIQKDSRCFESSSNIFIINQKISTIWKMSLKDFEDENIFEYSRTQSLRRSSLLLTLQKIRKNKVWREQDLQTEKNIVGSRSSRICDRRIPFGDQKISGPHLKNIKKKEA